MDFYKFEVEQEPIPYHVINPLTGEQTESIIYLYSPDSKFIADYERQLQKEILASTEEMKKEDIIEQTYKKVVIHCIAKWENVQWQDNDLECTIENKLLLIDNLPWLYRQLKAFLDDAKNFFTNS